MSQLLSEGVAEALGAKLTVYVSDTVNGQDTGQALQLTVEGMGIVWFNVPLDTF